jgi:hypothetical protein
MTGRVRNNGESVESRITMRGLRRLSRAHLRMTESVEREPEGSDPDQDLVAGHPSGPPVLSDRL